MTRLFDAISLRATQLANRIIVSPMCQYSAHDGCASPWHSVHLGGLAIGGAGLLFVEATAVTPEGRITPACLGLWSDANERALQGVVQLIRELSPIRLGIQLAHAGRKGSSQVPWDGGQLIAPGDGGWMPCAPSAIAHSPHESPPRSMSRDELAATREAFVAAARRAQRLGFDAVELHCAHGYLMHEFLSPVANRRDDEYGGSLVNRMRFPLEVFDAVRAALGIDIPLGVRISATDWLEHEDVPSWNLAESTAFCLELKQHGCDWIDVSSGGISPRQKIALGPGYQVPFAQAIKHSVEIPTFAVGMITTSEQAEAILANGQADCVALARAMLYDPRWAWHAANAQGGQVAAPEQYWRCLPSGSAHIFGDTHMGSR